MKLTFVNVGYGEAILLECPDPTRENGIFVMLIDGGSARADEFADCSSGRIPLAEYLRTEGLHHIDLMVSTHIHEDHICGLLPVAKDLLPGALWQTLCADVTDRMKPLDPAQGNNLSRENFMQALNDHRELCSLLAENGRPVHALKAGDAGTLCEGLTYQILSPSAQKISKMEEDLCRLYQEEGEAFFETLDALDRSLNNNSLILLLNYKGFRMLLPGDTNSLGYGDIAPEALAADLFKVGHHGQLDGVDQALLDVVRPKAVVSCASSDRRYNSAHPDVMDLLRRNNAALYFSDCPNLPGLDLSPHHAVTFTVDDHGTLSAEYII